ncbi:MAG: phenylalanine--tRNA ligase subunit beta [Rhodospirillaceae bacterium]|nr:phenylalanine--tRNA ligase subunit beta [Rhodospirillaceae bacterium]
MKFPLSWLLDHLDTTADQMEITEKLTSLGLEVEKVEDSSKALKGFVVGLVEEAVQHPNADRLKLCKVNTGNETIQVVCGAPNARIGIKGVFAPVGAIIPATGVQLKKTKIRGTESNGMLCSEMELGFSDDHEGIIELPPESPLGEEVGKILGLDDPIVQIAITPNRSDCLGVSGIARDLSAAGLGSVSTPEVKRIQGTFKNPIQVEFNLPEAQKNACPLFLTRYIRGVKNIESPEWMQNRLKAIDLRPISAIVDVTNYLTYDRNRPVHAFDADKLVGEKLFLKIMSGSQNFDALNEKTYVIDDGMTVIEDTNGVVSLGGVIGGEKTGCTGNTKNILIEIALFDPIRTATTGRKLGIESDARYRFERGIDPEFAADGMELATKMIIDICGGEPSDVQVLGTVPKWKREIFYRPERTQSLGGLSIENFQDIKILNDLGFKCKKNKTGFNVVPPSWRGDIDGEADLVEEVLRIIGYDKIPPISLPKTNTSKKNKLPLIDQRAGRTRRALATRGLLETVTYSFISKAKALKFDGAVQELVLENPISSELDVMRPSIFPNLIDALSKNADRGYKDAGFYEIGPQFEGDTEDAQRYVAAGVRAGNFQGRHWQGGMRTVDVFDAKADSLTALEAAGAPVNKIQVTKCILDWYHPGRSGEYRLGTKVLGRFGEIHPAVISHFDLSGTVVGFEVFLDAIPAPKGKIITTRPALNASDFQSVDRDFAFIVEEKIPSQEIVRAAKGVEKALISDVFVFDIYTGKGVGAGYKSVGITVRLQPDDRTLTEEEIESVARKIIHSVHRHTAGILRS